MKTAQYIFGLLQVCILLHIGFNRAAEFRFTNVVCKSYNMSWIVVNSCRVRPVNQSNAVDVNITLLQPAYVIHFESQFSMKMNGYKPRPYTLTIDVCRFLRKPYQSLGIVIFDLFQNYSNVNHPCPYVGNVYIDGLQISYDELPLPMSPGEYLIQFNMLFKRKLQFTHKYFFEIRN